MAFNGGLYGGWPCLGLGWSQSLGTEELLYKGWEVLPEESVRVLTRQTPAGPTSLFVVAFAHQPGS